MARPRGRRRCAAGSSSTRTSSTRRFYCASVTRCYPGRAGVRPRRPDADAREQELCALLARLGAALLRPRADRHGRRPRAAPAARARDARPTRRQELRRADGAIVIPLPHPSGASGWLNDPANRARLGKALTHVRARARAARRPALDWTVSRTVEPRYRRTFVRLLGFLRPYKASLVVSLAARGRARRLRRSRSSSSSAAAIDGIEARATATESARLGRRRRSSSSGSSRPR